MENHLFGFNWMEDLFFLKMIDAFTMVVSGFIILFIHLWILCNGRFTHMEFTTRLLWMLLRGNGRQFRLGMFICFFGNLRFLQTSSWLIFMGSWRGLMRNSYWFLPFNLPSILTFKSLQVFQKFLGVDVGCSHSPVLVDYLNPVGPLDVSLRLWRRKWIVVNEA